MLYPHEREEQKQLLNSLLERVRESSHLLGICSILSGVFVILFGLIDSFFLHGIGFPWKATWLVGFLSIGFSHLLFLFLRSQKKKTRFLNRRQRFVLARLVPSLLAGVVVGGLITNPIQAALMWVLFYGLSLHSLTAFTLPRVKNFSNILLIFALSCFVLTHRHELAELDTRHVANISLLLGLGCTNLTLGAWNLFLKPA